LILNVCNENYTIPSSDWVECGYAEGCELAVAGAEGEGYILGDTFFKKRYLVFD